MIEAVILDWAGTTIDYGCFAPVQAFIDSFFHFGVEVTVEETRKPMGMLKKDHIRTMFQMERIADAWRQKQGRDWTEADVEAVYGQFETKLFSILEQYTTPKPGVLETVAALRARGIKIGSTTGYTEQMMDLVTVKAAEQGYAPDCWVSAEQVGGKGRPYPYMIFENMKRLQVTDVKHVLKVGDTVSDIQEGLRAGVISIGVIEGSSELGLSEAEFSSLREEERTARCKKVAETFQKAGAHFVLQAFSDLLTLMDFLPNSLA